MLSHVDRESDSIRVVIILENVILLLFKLHRRFPTRFHKSLGSAQIYHV